MYLLRRFLTQAHTLHSSSLLALLFFCSLSELNPITIDGTKYTKCFFEIKNKVYHNASLDDKPSNIDVVLYSPSKNKLLYLESKFTEYLSHGKATAGEKYSGFLKLFAKAYKSIKITSKKVAKDKRKVQVFEIEKSVGSNSIYLEGIKQLVSHIIGIATGPIPENPPEFLDIYNNNAPSIEFRSIIFNLDEEEYNAYSTFYNDAVDAINNNRVLKSALKSDAYTYRTDFTISHAISYQELLDKNQDYHLPDRVKSFYGL